MRLMPGPLRAGVSKEAREAVGRLASRLSKDPRVTVRVVLGALLAANLVLAAVVFKPWGGSPEELRRNLLQLRGAERERRASVERFREIAGKVEKARKQSDDFFREYFLERRTAYSGIVSELSRIAQQVGIQAKEHTFTVEPVEGSENLAMLIITGHYEGSYGNLVHFVNEIDRTERFITIESMQATPQQSGGTLNINVKLNAFVVGEGEEL